MHWWEPALRGVAALVAAFVVYVIARHRFPDREGDDAPTDLGLD